MIPYAAILTHDRNGMATNLVDKMVADGVTTFVLNHNPAPSDEFQYFNENVFVWVERNYIGEDFNISTLWCDLLDQVRWHHERRYGNTEYSVTVFNDDANPSLGFCDAMSVVLEVTGVDVASIGMESTVVVGPPRQIPLFVRPAGWAWTLRGWSDLRPDESMAVWYSDDDLWQQALAGKGFALTSQASCGNLDADGNFSRNPWWQDQAGRDRERYKEKHGFYAW